MVAILAISELLSCSPLSWPCPTLISWTCLPCPTTAQEGRDAGVDTGLSLAEALPPGTGRLPGQDHLFGEDAGDELGLGVALGIDLPGLHQWEGGVLSLFYRVICGASALLHIWHLATLSIDGAW